MAQKLPDIAQLVQYYQEQSIAKSTDKNYNSHVRQYEKWCELNQLYPFYPPTEQRLMFYASYRAKNVTYNTIKGDLYAIRWFSISMGYPIDLKTMINLRSTMHGIKRVKGGTRPDQRLPITIETLKRFRKHVDLNDFDELVVFTAMVVATFGLLRTGEFAVENKITYDPIKTLYMKNIRLIKDKDGNPNYFILKLKVSKTDIFRQGVDVTIGHGIGDIDPVNLLLKMIAMRATMTRNRKVYANLRIMPNNFLFCMKNGKPLSRYNIKSKLQYFCNKCNLDSNRYKGHSFRIGGATSLARRGFPSYIIQILGRWRSDCYRIYTRYNHNDIANVQKAMAHGEIKHPNKIFLYQDEAKAHPLTISK